MSNETSTLRLVFPQWQGGNNPPYYLGSLMLEWLAPETRSAVETVRVPAPQPGHTELKEENGINGRSAINMQLADARNLIHKHQPENIATLGGGLPRFAGSFCMVARKVW